MTSLWAHDAKEPRSGYIWRTRNKLGDKRVQTDIIGGAYCITGKCVHSVCRLSPMDRSFRVAADGLNGLIACMIGCRYEPFVGPKNKSSVVDPRTGIISALDPEVDKGLTRAIDLMIPMHKALGHELWSIGWDVMVRDGVPLFIEFNINNGALSDPLPGRACWTIRCCPTTQY
jgi:hypothetical protein